MTAGTLLFRLLVAVVALSPLPLGSHRPWAWSALAILVGALLIAWVATAAAGRASAPVPPRRLAVPILGVGLALGWATVQALPVVPPPLANPLWAEAGAALGRALPATVSVDPAMTWTALLRTATFVGVFWLAVQLGRARTRAREGLVAVAWAGVAYAVYGLVMHFGGWERILWMEKTAYLGDLTATFVNRNAYGAYAGIGALCCLALGAEAMAAVGRGVGARRAAALVFERALPPLIGAAVLGTALMLTHSRGAFLATVAGAVVLLVALRAARLLSSRSVVAAAVILAVGGGFVVGSSGGTTLVRLAEQTEFEGDRGQLYRLTGDAIADAPWTGHGFGAFTAAFRAYRDPTLPRPVIYDFAHNVHLEFAMDLGVPAALAFAAAIVWLAWVCARGLVVRRRDRLYPALALAALTLVAVHGLVDFSAQMPAVATTLAFLLGLGCAQSWRTSGGDGEVSSDDEDEGTAPSPRR